MFYFKFKRTYSVSLTYLRVLEIAELKEKDMPKINMFV